MRDGGITRRQKCNWFEMGVQDIVCSGWEPAEA